MKTNIIPPIRYTNENPIHAFIQRRVEIREKYELDIQGLILPEMRFGVEVPKNEFINTPMPELGKDFIVTTEIDWDHGIFYHEPNNLQGVPERLVDQLMQRLHELVEAKPECIQAMFAYKAHLYEQAAHAAQLMEVASEITGKPLEEIHQAADVEMPIRMKKAQEIMGAENN